MAWLCRHGTALEILPQRVHYLTRSNMIRSAYDFNRSLAYEDQRYIVSEEELPRGTMYHVEHFGRVWRCLLVRSAPAAARELMPVKRWSAAAVAPAAG